MLFFFKGYLENTGFCQVSLNYNIGINVYSTSGASKIGHHPVIVVHCSPLIRPKVTSILRVRFHRFPTPDSEVTDWYIFGVIFKKSRRAMS